MTTFLRRSQLFDESTGLSTETITTCDGSAVRVRGTPATYAALGLSERQAPTLLFTPDAYPLRADSDEFVRPGDEVEWVGATYVVRDVDPVAPDGFVIVARIVVQRGGA